MSEVINTVNNRPLTKVSSDSDDIRAITPNDIILLRENNSQFDEEIEFNYSPRKTWKMAHVIADKFFESLDKAVQTNTY